MEPTILQTIWFALIIILFAAYSVLDGFDLGAGIILPFVAKNDDDRRSVFNAIGPVWDGNEVWLLAGGGALFAAFPQAYATVFSGFYLAVILLVFALMLRAVSLEFWLYDESRRKLWAWVLTTSSFLAALLMGVAAGNIVQGIPLDAAGNHTGGFWGLLRPFPLSAGILVVAAFAVHGALFLATRTTGSSRLVQRCNGIARMTSYAITGLFSLSFLLLAFFAPARLATGMMRPVFLAGLALLLGSFGALLTMLKAAQTTRAFAASTVFIAALWLCAGSINYPFIVPATASTGLHISTAASSALTLKVMLVIALLGMPVVIGYTVWIYKVFGKRA